MSQSELLQLFAAKQRQSKQSFAVHRNLIKQLGRGDNVLCEACQQPLELTIEGANGSVKCQKGCTFISLEMA